MQDTPVVAAFLSLACNGLLVFRNGTEAFPNPADTTVVPDLAATTPEQPDEQTYIFRLRDDVRWHNVAPVNGRTFVASDVAAHVRRALSEPRSALRPAFAAIGGVDTPDQHTIRYSLKAPYAPFLALVAGGMNRYILPHELTEATNAQSALAGTGAFVLEQHQRGVRAVFRRNSDYFKRDAAGGRLPYVDGFAWVVLPDSAARLQAERARQTSLTWLLQPDEADQLRATNGNDYGFQQAPAASNYLYMRLDQPPFDDTRVRQALSLAIDREALIRTLGHGSGEADLPVPAFLRDWALPLAQLGDTASLYARDLQRAKQLLTAAGHADGLSTTLTYTPQYGAAFMQAAAIVQRSLAEAGVAAAPRQLDYAAYLTTAFRGDFEGLAYAPRSLYPDADPYLSYFYLPGGLFYQDHSNDVDLRTLVTRQQQTLSAPARKAVLDQIQRYLTEQQYRVYDASIPGAFAWQRAVANYRGPSWLSCANAETAWLTA
jgi:peptide/nickel transport system substrate-binding protein